MCRLLTAYGAALVTARQQAAAKHEEYTREHCACDKYGSRNGHWYRISPDVLRNFPAEYVSSDDPVQRGALFFHAISDDEKFAGKDERLLGDDCDADGRQLDENDLPGRNSQRPANASGSVQLLLYQRNGDCQRRHLYCRSQDNGHHNEDQ